MPITRKQFEWGVDAKVEEWMEKIRAFLTEHKDEAFTLEEVKSEWKPRYDSRTWFISEEKVLEEALNKLVEQGMAEERTIRDTNYYAHKEEELPF